MNELLKRFRLLALFLLSALSFPLLSAQQTTETLIFIHTDIAGSVIGQSNAAGNVIWRENYRPYGERTVNSSAAAGNRQFFHGKAFDADTGLSYFGARYYDAVVGRFMGVDAQGFYETNLHSFNRYAYGNNNPYKFIDPNGASPLSVFLLEAAKQTGIGYGLGVAADAIGQVAAFGEVNWAMAASSNAAIAGGTTGLLSGVLAGAAKSAALARTSGESTVRGATALSTTSAGAENSATAVTLGKSLASEAQMGEAGIRMAGPGTNRVFRDASRVAKEHGGSPGDWAKVRSSSWSSRGEGTKIETHWVENVGTGQRVEFKTKLTD
jgi:RHS repeat-associated protein